LANKEFSTNVAKAFVCSFTRVLNTREKLGEQRKPSPAANNYPVNFIHNGRQLNRQQEMNDIDQRGFIILPYAKGFSTRVAKVLRDFNVKVAHKSIRPISNILKKSQKTVFVGQTSRVKEHTKALATLDENSLLDKHDASQSLNRFGEC